MVYSLYPDKVTTKKATALRNARMGKDAHRIEIPEMLQGEVILKVVRKVFSSSVYIFIAPTNSS